MHLHASAQEMPPVPRAAHTQHAHAGLDAHGDTGTRSYMHTDTHTLPPIEAVKKTKSTFPPRTARCHSRQPVSFPLPKGAAAAGGGGGGGGGGPPPRGGRGG